MGPKCNYMYLFKGETEGEQTQTERRPRRGRDSVTMEAETGIIEPQAKEQQKIPEPGRGPEKIVTWSLQREHSRMTQPYYLLYRAVIQILLQAKLKYLC